MKKGGMNIKNNNGTTTGGGGRGDGHGKMGGSIKRTKNAGFG